MDSAQAIPPSFAGALDVAGGELSIGSAWQPFIGLLDDVRIYKRVLTESEIRASYEERQDAHSDPAYELVD